MKPYFLVIYNKIKIALKHIRCKNLTVLGIQMMGWNTKLFFHPSSTVLIESKFVSDGRLVIISDRDSILHIGKNVYFNEDGMISCKGKITIGKGCKFGPNVKIFDNNHKFDAVNGVSDKHSVGEIEIGNNCWIGTNSVILKGAKIGDNSVIGAGCIISGEIPAASIVTQGRDLNIKSTR